MKSLNFPICIIDDFLDSPNLMVDYAKNQKFISDEHSKWPGERSQSLHELNPLLFNNYVLKTLQSFYNENSIIEFKAYSVFQRIGEECGAGWVHYDSGFGKNNILTSILYLSEDDQDSGTGIFELKDLEYYNIIENSMKTREIDFKNRKNSDDERIDHNNFFEESIKIKSKFNRIFMFDSRLWHSAYSFFENSKFGKRLTLTTFIESVIVRDSYGMIIDTPIPRILKNCNI
jgi:hypothetical protein